MNLLQPGQTAPDFYLLSTTDQKISLRSFRGEPVILVFYPADWNPICGDQLALCNETQTVFKEHHAHLLGISIDNIWSHLAFSKNNKLSFPLLSDFEPKGAVAKSYGAYDITRGLCSRALFVIDPLGKINWSYLSPIGANPGVAGLLEALAAIPKQLAAPPLTAPLSQYEARAVSY